MNKDAIIKELRSILNDYHYNSDDDNGTEHMSKDVVTALENLLGGLLKWNIVKDQSAIHIKPRTAYAVPKAPSIMKLEEELI